MKVALVCIGSPRGDLAEVISGYESRVARYFRFEAVEVKETPHRALTVTQVIAAEGESLLARIPAHTELVALDRPGKAWTSDALARYLEEAAVTSVPGVTFVIGGAYGLAPAVLSRADHTLSLSAMTFPHEIARLVLAEQLYRAGTILRGEPYHKGKIK